MTIRLQSVKLPDYGVPNVRPELAAEIYQRRFATFVDRAWAAGLNVVAVYADREHCANLSYLTGFDPRFEEALLVVAKGGSPVLITGPENQGVASLSAISAEVRLYQPFGLMGQSRLDTPDLDTLLKQVGVASGSKIGVAGWKYFGLHEAPNPERWLEIPSFLADALRAISSDVVNAGPILMDSTKGMRATLEIEELAQFEFAATHGSEAVKRAIWGIKPGISEFDLVSQIRPIGLPQGAHTMLSSGERAANGLNSPTGRTIALGDQFTTAFCYWGSLTSRAGFVARGPEDLPEGAKDYFEKLVAPFFDTAAEWYETIGIGVSGGLIDSQVRKRLDTPFFNLILNPGHLIHIDEWMNTPVYPGSTETFHSHSAVQLDIIPATGSAYFTSNIEDGIALLDERGRAEFAERFPEAWGRIQMRRAFMSETLGIKLKPEVLPFSNLSGYLSPFLLAPEMVCVRG